MAPSARCAHSLSQNKKAERIQNLVAFTKTATNVQLSTKLIEVWATPQCSITDPRILLTLGASPEGLYKDEYGEKTLRDREENGSCCSECAEKYRDFLLFAQQIHDEQFKNIKISNKKAKENGFSYTPKTGKSDSPDIGMVCLSLDGGLVSIVCLLFASRRTLGDESLTQFVDWYVGCSTGAMLALALAKGYSLTESFYLYWEMKNEIFLDKSTMKRLFGNVVDKQTVRVNGVLNRVFSQEDTFEKCPKRLTVPALNITMSPSKLYTFRNYPIQGSHWDKSVSFYDAARASSAAPTYFHPHMLGDCKYVDGSLAANCPLTILFREYDKCRQSGHETSLACVLSIGTGEPLETLRRYKAGTSIGHRSKHLRDMATLLMEQVVGQEKSAIECAEDRCTASGIPFFRLSPVGIAVRIDQVDDGKPNIMDKKLSDKLMEMIFETFKYLLNNLDYIDKLGATLMGIRNAKREMRLFCKTRKRSQTIL